MKHQEGSNEYQIQRFELSANTIANASDRAFNLYCILIIPNLIGAFLMYNVFQLVGEYFIYAFIFLTILILNIYVFYQKRINQTHTIKLLILDDYIQIMNGKQIYFQEHINQLNTEIIKCGISLKPAIKISNEDLKSFTIGLKISADNIETAAIDQLSQPDYTLKSRRQSEALMNTLQY